MANKMSYKEGVYDQKIDIWSIGVVCYNMLMGKSVFDAKFLDELCRKIEVGDYVLPITISREAVSFFLSMLQYNSQKRLRAVELANHPFLTKNIKEFSKIDTEKISKKIDSINLKTNIKNNNSIKLIVDEKNNQKILNIEEKGEGFQLKRAHLINSLIFAKLYDESNDSNNHSAQKTNISNNNIIQNNGCHKDNRQEKTEDNCNIM